MSVRGSPIGVGFVFGCDGCGDLHLFSLPDHRGPIEILASWGWSMRAWGLDLCPTCRQDDVVLEAEDEVSS